MDRRRFLKGAGAGAGLLFGVSAAADDDMHGVESPPGGKPGFDPRRPDVAVVGAGAFGLWTAHYLNRLGANVTVVDLYGPGNVRSSSGDETRGLKSAYGDRAQGLQWAAWAREAEQRWQRWDDEWRARNRPRLYFPTGDLILRPQMDTLLTQSIANWDELGMTYEMLSMDEVRHRFPSIRADKFGVAVFEPAAGVIRSRSSLEALAEVFRAEGGQLIVDQVLPPASEASSLHRIALKSGVSISAEHYVFACGPWLPKALPDVMTDRLRTPMGHAYYFGTPPGDPRFTWPNFPSYDVPGAVGWPALIQGDAGFRFRTGGRLLQDPDTSERRIPEKHVKSARATFAGYFPDLADAPLTATHSAHYEYSSDSNLIVDTHPDLDNLWIVGGGSAEGFKFGPVLGEYVARRVTGLETDPALADDFRLKDAKIAPYPEHWTQKDPGWLDEKLDAYCEKRMGLGA